VQGKKLVEDSREEKIVIFYPREKSDGFSRGFCFPRAPPEGSKTPEKITSLFYPRLKG
jgi:hypothetical protein